MAHGVTEAPRRSTEPLGHQNVYFLALVEDEVDDLASEVRAEVPAPYCATGILVMLGLTVPRCQLKHVENLKVCLQGLRRQRRYLFEHRVIRDDAIHLTTQPLPDERLHIFKRPRSRVLARTNNLLGLGQQP